VAAGALRGAAVRQPLATSLAALPGALVIAAALAGYCPGSRDLPTYFSPLRERTASVLRGTQAPFWNADEGCGEPYFANPQTGLLYPPDWLAAVLPGRQAVGVEIGLHLALLGAGCALLAARLGAMPWLALAAGWGVVLSGPVVTSAGVLNNLDTLAWIPWLLSAALAGATGWIAVTAAAAYLGGEPQLAALGALIALTLAPRRRTLLGVLLGLGVVALQLVPFVVWAAGGDRGAAGQAAVTGAVLPAELVAVLAPGAPLPARPDRFVTALAVPAWGLLLAIWALLERGAAGRRLALWGWGLTAAGVLAGVGWGGRAWELLTLGLLRYPGRLLFLAVVALLPAGAALAAKGKGPPWLGALAGGAVLGVGLLAGAPWPGVTVQAIAGAVALVGGEGAGVAAVLGAAALAFPHVAELRLAKTAANPVPACLIAQRAHGRVYAVEPSWNQVAAVAAAGEQRMFDLGWGYTALLDGRSMARTFAPLQSRALAAQLAQADRGPAGRWWLDTMAASRLVAQHPIAGFPELCHDDGVFVYANPAAWPEALVLSRMPPPGEWLPAYGAVLAHAGLGDERQWRVEVGRGGGILVWLSTPDPGWAFTVDGAPAVARRGEGIVQGVQVPAGEHRVAARYRPPGMTAAAVVSLISVLALLGVAWRPS
jgi:hypothetical protein